MKKILLAGSTGHLGKFVLNELLGNGFDVRAIVRNEQKLRDAFPRNNKLEIMRAELTRPDSLSGCCRDMDAVISTVGITRQKEGLTYMDVDYQANLNLLEDAKRYGVKKFIYVSVLNGDKMTRLKICEAKEKFVGALRNSGLDYSVIRPTGYFSDMAEFYDMAKRGRVYLLGDGKHVMNPIHGADLAKICVDALSTDREEAPIGGPQQLSHREIAEIAFSVAGKRPRISYIPGWVSRSALFLMRTFTGSRIYGPLEFFITVLSVDFIAPPYGSHRLKEYFEELTP